MVDTLATFGARYIYNCRIFCITLATLGARYFFLTMNLIHTQGPAV